jgi:hypothetical protein
MPKQQQLADRPPITMTIENMSRYGIVSERTHVNPAEIKAFIDTAGLAPADNRADGQPLYDPVQVRQAAREIAGCAHGHDAARATAVIARVADNELTTCAASKHNGGGGPPPTETNSTAPVGSGRLCMGH